MSKEDLAEILDLFKQYIKFGYIRPEYDGEIKKIHISDQAGNYRSTLRENFDTLNILGWSPSDKLQSYIQSL